MWSFGKGEVGSEPDISSHDRDQTWCISPKWRRQILPSRRMWLGTLRC